MEDKAKLGKTDEKGVALPAGFERVKQDMRRKRLLVRISGLEKMGKTHWALTAPSPIAFFDIDRSAEDIVWKFLSEKDIYHKEYRGSREGDDEAYKAAWTAFKRDYYAALDAPGIRTIIVDTETELWEMARLAEFGKLSKVLSREYGPVNKEFREVIDAAQSSEKNLVMISRLKKQYRDDKWNGRYESRGFGETGFLVHVNVETTQNEDGVFVSRIVNCRHDPSANGETFEGDMSTFQFVALRVFTGSAYTDWA